MAGVVGPCPPGVTELAQVDVSPVDWIAAHGVDTLEINQQACRLSLQLAGIQAQLDGVSALANGSLTRAVAEDNHAWMLTNGFLVFFLQLGFAALTAGCVRAKNLKNVLMKNVIDACFGAIAWWLVGFGIAYGDGVNGNGFLGTKDYVLSNVPGTYYGGGDRHAFWFFQWAFSATAATIVSGAVAERIKFEAYLIFTFLCSGWIYPVIAHWGWSDSGWLSAFRATVQPDGSTRFDPLGGSGLFDFAGGGVRPRAPRRPLRLEDRQAPPDAAVLVHVGDGGYADYLVWLLRLQLRQHAGGAPRGPRDRHRRPRRHQHHPLRGRGGHDGPRHLEGIPQDLRRRPHEQLPSGRPRGEHLGLRAHGALGGRHHRRRRRLVLLRRLQPGAQAQDRRPARRLRGARRGRYVGSHLRRLLRQGLPHPGRLRHRLRAQARRHLRRLEHDRPPVPGPRGDRGVGVRAQLRHLLRPEDDHRDPRAGVAGAGGHGLQQARGVQRAAHGGAREGDVRAGRLRHGLPGGVRARSQVLGPPGRHGQRSGVDRRKALISLI